MRDQLHLIELADRYLRGELNETDHRGFEERLRGNSELRELVEDQRVLQQGIERLALRPAIDKAYRSYRFGKWAPGVGGAVIVAVVSVGGWMLAHSGNEHGAMASKATDTTVVENIVTWSDSADARLPMVALADTLRDTTLFTGTGVAQDVLVDSTTTTNEVKAGVNAYVVKHVTVDPAPRKIIEGLTEALDSQPMFVGGNEALRIYLLNNLRFPPQAEARAVQGRVTTSFVILSDGTVDDAQIVSGIGSGCDEEALRLITAMPKWIPAYIHGKPVSVRTTMPIVFRSSPPVMY